MIIKAARRSDSKQRNWLTSDVPSDDRLHRYYSRLSHEHGAALELLAVLPNLFWHLIDIDCDQMVWNDVLQLLEPEQRDACEEFALVRDSLIKNRHH